MDSFIKYLIVFLLLFSVDAMRAINILMIVDTFPWYTKTPIKNMAKGLTQAGHLVDIYSLKIPASPMSYEEKVAHAIFYEEPNFNVYDVICCQYGNIGKEFVKLKKNDAFTAKLVTCFRGADITSRSHATSEGYAELFEYGDLFLPVCDHYKSILVDLGCNPDKISVHYSPIETQEFFIKRTLMYKRNIHIVSVNRLSKKKGMEDAIHAVAKIVKKGYKVRYTIAGDGGQREKLVSLSKKLGLENVVKFVGWLSHKEVKELLKEADIFLSPSITTASGLQEGIPNSLKEAMASGLPVISTWHSGISEMVTHGVDGYLVEEHNVEALVQYLQKLIQDHTLRYNIGKKASKKVYDLFDIAINTEQLELLFSQLLGV